MNVGQMIDGLLDTLSMDGTIAGLMADECRRRAAHARGPAERDTWYARADFWERAGRSASRLCQPASAANGGRPIGKRTHVA